MKKEFYAICFVCAMLHRHRDAINHDEKFEETKLSHFKLVHSNLIEKIKKIYQSFEEDKSENIEEIVLDKGIEMYLKDPQKTTDINVFI